MNNIAAYRKAVVAIIAALGVLLVSALEVFGDWLSEDAASWINTGIAIIGAIGVYLVRNATVIDKIGTGQTIIDPPVPPPPASH